MPLTRDKKVQVIEETGQLIDGSKLIVLTRYRGTSVKALQQLRAEASVSGTTVRVVKNRLFKQALGLRPNFKDVDTNLISGQLLYAFNADDELAPAQALAAFAKLNPQLEFVGAINSQGQVLSADEVKHLASLPSMDQLRAQLAATLRAPVSGFVGMLNGSIRSLVNVLNAKARA